jgi:hypothetical protein
MGCTEFFNGFLTVVLFATNTRIFLKLDCRLNQTGFLKPIWFGLNSYI